MATTTTTTVQRSESPTLLDKLDELAPPSFAEFDAFPKLPATYKQRSESRGFLTLFAIFVAFLLVLNDLGEFIWGWPDYEFGVDSDTSNGLDINVDMVVNMQCQYLTIDLRDAVGDRLWLSDAFRRDGTKFDVGQATTLKEHAAMLSARQAVAQSRRSRGFFATLSRKTGNYYKPTYNYQPDGSACRIYGTITAKRVTANLHVTTLGHGYASQTHVDHKQMNLSHVITEFSFGPYFPEIVQPLDNSFEITHDPFISYQYFMHIVPTTYIAPRSQPLNTHQYSVTHYTRVLEHHRGVPGIFFKFDLDPMQLTIHQRTMPFIKLMIRMAGIFGGFFVCMGYAVKITTRAIDTVAGTDKAAGIVAAESSSVSATIRKKLGSTDLRLRPSQGGRDRVIRQGSSWVVDGGSPYGSYAGTPVSATGFPTSPFPGAGGSPYSASGFPASPAPGSGFSVNGSANGFGPPGTPGFGPTGSPRPAQSATLATAGTPYTPGSSTLGLPYGPPSVPGTPNLYSHFPPTPNTANGYTFATQQQGGAGLPPRRGERSLSGGKKED